MEIKTVTQSSENDWKRGFPTAFVQLGQQIEAQIDTALVQLKAFSQKTEAKALAKDLYFNILKSVLVSID